MITYWSAWLRCYHPTALFAGLLRHQPMGFYPKHVVVNDAMRAGVKFLPIDLRYSQAQTVVEGNAIRLSLSDVHGFGPEQIEIIETERQRGPYRSLNDLVKRTQLDRPHVEALVLAGALDYLGERRQLLWDIAEAYRLAKRPRELPLHNSDEQVSLLPMDQATRLSSAFAMTGTSLEAHLTELRRDVFTKVGATPISELPRLKHGQAVKIGGVIVARQHPPTAKGLAFLAVVIWTKNVKPQFFQIADVMIPPQVYDECRDALRKSIFVIVDGTLQQLNPSIVILATKVARLP